jgi:uncharacterized phiE125 gp8 family phage protein
MFSDIRLVVPPAVEPITIDDLKFHARIVEPDDPDVKLKNDALLTRDIVSSRLRCEAFTRRSLMTQTLAIWYDCWDGIGIIEKLPRQPIQEILSITVYDASGAASVIDPLNYRTNRVSITLNVWPSYAYSTTGIEVMVKAGYGDDPEDVPEILRLGMLEYAAMLYEQRLGEGMTMRYEALAAAGGSAIPSTVADKWGTLQLRYV